MKKHHISKQLTCCSLFLLSLFFTTPPALGEEVNLRDSINDILNTEEVDFKERLFKTYRMLRRNDPKLPEYEDLFLNHVQPFFEKNVSDKMELQMYKSIIYHYISIKSTYSDLDVAKEKGLLYAEKALQAIEPTDYDDIKARMYMQYARIQSIEGEMGVAHDYFYKAISLYEELEDYPAAINCLYSISIVYANIIDLDGMKRVIGDMERIVPLDPQENMQYKLNAVKSVYFRAYWENDSIKDPVLKDSILTYARKNINLITNHREKLDPFLSPAWEYYNMATHFYNFYTDKNDSIIYYLNKALEEKKHIPDKSLEIEVDISVYSQFAEMYIKEKNYKQAEKDLLYVLSLLNKLGEDRNSTSVEFTQAYRFMVELYEATNRPAEALKYQKMLQESESRRYSSEKINAINEVAAKYETEKKQTQIETLQKEKKSSQMITMLAVILTSLLLISLLLLIRFFKSRKEKMEQSIYEKALLAEMKHNELEEIKRGLQTSSTQLVVEQVVQRLNESILAQEKKKRYEEALLKLDMEAFDKAFIIEKDKITNMDMKYILCFAANMDNSDTALIFNVEQASVRTVRYRIKKKINKQSSIFSLI